MSAWYIVVWVAILVIVYFGADFFIAKRKSDKRKNYICYHTSLDCESCMNSSSCKQKLGPGFIELKHPEE